MGVSFFNEWRRKAALDSSKICRIAKELDAAFSVNVIATFREDYVVVAFFAERWR